MSELVKMFNDYANEKGFGANVVYAPETGFATYHLNGDECYIEDIYVIPEKRKSHEASKLADSIIEIAKNSGAKLLTGSVNIKANGKENSIKTLLAYGMSPCALSGDMIYFSKEI